jgi:O-antigen ligase
MGIAILAFWAAGRASRANLLFNALIAIGALYALYGFVLAAVGLQQFTLFYHLPLDSGGLSGPFVQRNSFATFEGIAALAAVARLVEQAQERLVFSRGGRLLALSVMRFAQSSSLLILALILTVSALVATGSRGGVLATLCAGVTMALPFLILRRRESGRAGGLAVAAGTAAILAGLVLISGEMLGSRMEALIDAGSADQVRVALWAAAWRMIENAPWLGLGLGSFQDAYPLYATQAFPYLMDKAHSDYLEFAAGLGVPAALCWWAAMGWCVQRLLRGVFVRRKDRIYSLAALGATVLVGLHSAVDFSLQMPAVAAVYAALLGLGIAQSYTSEERAGA